jgi:AraC-like DNA-binding protein
MGTPNNQASEACAMHLSPDNLQAQIQAAFFHRLLEVLDTQPPAKRRAAFNAANLSYDHFAAKPTNFPGTNLFDLLHILNRPEYFPGIVLRFGTRRQILDLGILGYTVISCRDLRQAMQVIQRYHSLTASAYQMTFLEENGRAAHRQWIKPGFRSKRIEIDEEHITGIWSVLQQLLPGDADTTRVHLRLAFPAPAYADRYHQLFPGDILFDQEESELSYPAEWLALRIHSADDTVEQACEAQCNRMLGKLGPGEVVVDDVRRVILSIAPNHSLSLAQVAARLNLSVRTLERRLQSAGTSFRSIDNEIRMGLAAQYLQLGYLSGKEISYMLGYGQPATFYRAFKNWFGITPKQFRINSLPSSPDVDKTRG